MAVYNLFSIHARALPLALPVCDLDTHRMQLPPQTIAFLYQSGLGHIRDAYQASRSAMETAQQAALHAAERYQASGEDDSVYEYEDGQSVLTSSTQHELDYAAMEAVQSSGIVREAFITSAFHYWERWARSRTGLNKGGFADLEKAVQDEGISTSENLINLNTLNNLLKHNNSQRALDLVATSPDLFFTKPYSTLRRDIHWRLRITNDVVDDSFKIVEESGPR